jgi:hypothetical protein
MPSTESSRTGLAWKVTVGVLVVAIVGYSVVVAQRLLLGVLLGALVYLFAWLLSTVDVRDAFGTTRAAVTALVCLLVIAYSLLIAQQFLLGFVTVTVVVAVSWLTSPRGPLAAYLYSR